MLTCIIIDDDSYAIEALKNYVIFFPGLEVIKTFNDPLVALTDILNSEPVDLILLDIDMPNINGIELSKEIRDKTKKLVFTTGHSKFAYDAIKVRVDDYLLKPFTAGEFTISMTKIFSDKHSEKQDFTKDAFLVKSKEDNLKMVYIKYSAVISVESKLNYVLISTKEKKILTYMSLTEISKILFKLPGFLKFNRSFIIAQDYIDFIEGNLISMVDGTKVTVGEFYRKDFASFVQKKILKADRKR